MRWTLVAIVLLISACSSGDDSDMLEMQEKGMDYVESMKIYNRFDGSSLVNTGREKLDCEGCYRLSYEYIMDSIEMARSKVTAEIELTTFQNEIVGVKTHYGNSTLGNQCISSDQCMTPMMYMIQSNCPFESHCIDSTCKVTCPLIQGCQEDANCDCSERWNSIDCRCINNKCISVEAR